MEYLLPFCRNARDASAFKDCCSKIVRLKFIPASIQVGLFGSAVRISRQKDGYQYSLILCYTVPHGWATNLFQFDILSPAKDQGVGLYNWHQNQCQYLYASGFAVRTRHPLPSLHPTKLHVQAFQQVQNLNNSVIVVCSFFVI